MAYINPSIDTTKYPNTSNDIRVPTIGGDDGTWGYILNNLLATSHAVTNSNGPSGATAGFISNIQVLSGGASYTAKLYPGEVVLCNATSGNITVTLPDATKTINFYSVKKTDTGSNTVTVNTSSSQTIDGSSSATISVAYVSLTFASDGGNWYII